MKVPCSDRNSALIRLGPSVKGFPILEVPADDGAFGAKLPTSGGEVGLWKCRAKSEHRRANANAAGVKLICDKLSHLRHLTYWIAVLPLAPLMASPCLPDPPPPEPVPTAPAVGAVV